MRQCDWKEDEDKAGKILTVRACDLKLLDKKHEAGYMVGNRYS
jgi:hypothetical protein